MSERRRAFRVYTVGRVALRALSDREEHDARLRVAARSVPEVSRFTGLEESLGGEERVQIQMLERMAYYLNRIDQRMEELCQLQRGGHSATPIFSDPIRLSLSAAGLSGPLELPEGTPSMVELTLDLLDSSLPLIPAVASVVRAGDELAAEHEKPGLLALHFEEITDIDRERIYRFATRIQRLSLRPRERKEPS